MIDEIISFVPHFDPCIDETTKVEMAYAARACGALGMRKLRAGDVRVEEVGLRRRVLIAP